MTSPTVSGLGEAGILQVLHRRFRTVPAAQDWPEGSLGPGDDAAVVPAPDGRFVISTDAMAQDRDFRLVWPSGAVDSGYSTGWKAAAQNLSDINAMGARASSLLLALTMPGHTPVRWLDRFAAGIAGAVHHLGADTCRIAGGDLGGDDRITVCVTVTGDLDGRRAVRRTIPREHRGGTGPLDLALCGRAGWAAAGLSVLQTPRTDLDRALDRTGAHRLAARAAAAQLRPRPILTAGPSAAAHGALAMLDVSDGLVRDAGRLGSANGLAVELDEEWVRGQAAELAPLAFALGEDARDWVRTGGEDYGLLAVFTGGAALPSGFTRVGRLVAPGGTSQSLNPPGARIGWDHFGG
ncbi:thiamine-monophosphate kinase [Micrococcus sp. IITD107]|uniref:thiamine-phosphate kinase n=1 Tax=Micrococcus sp. IITD107 TaxID=3342790 RepID=UPI0035B865AA